MTHQCPGLSCEAEVGVFQLMCPAHWCQVPEPLRRAVWGAWKHGAGAGTRAHTAAIRAAIAAVNRAA